MIDKAVVVVISDSAHHGTRVDTSGERLVELVEELGFPVLRKEIIPDERAMISSHLEGLCALPEVRIILTTGGTGLGPRDVTPEATLEVIDRRVPGMAEAMRAQSLESTPLAMLSRQVVGVRKHTLIVNLPGSPKAVEECFTVIRPVLKHAADLISGHTEHGPKHR